MCHGRNELVCVCCIRVCEPREAGVGEGGHAAGLRAGCAGFLACHCPPCRPSCSPTSGPAARSWESWEPWGRVTEEALQAWGPALLAREAAGIPGESWGLQVTCSGRWSNPSTCTLVSSGFSGIVQCRGFLCSISTSGSRPGLICLMAKGL